MSLKSMIWNGLLVAALCLAVFLLYRIFQQYSLDQIVQSVRSIPLFDLLHGTSLCGGVLSVPELLRPPGDPLARQILALFRIPLASFISLSLGHNIGFAGPQQRRLSLSFLFTLGADGGGRGEDHPVLRCHGRARADHAWRHRHDRQSRRCRAPAAHRPGKCAHLRFAGAGRAGVYAGLAFFIRGTLGLWRWSFQLPRFSIAVAQVAVGTINFMLVSACLHQMLSAFGDVAFFRSVTAYVLANSAILATHVPGGLGVLEATVSYVVPKEASIGALIAFRCAYFFIPLALGTTLLVISEVVFRRRSRGANEAADERAEAQSV